jgi:hypothetical protein
MKKNLGRSLLFLLLFFLPLNAMELASYTIAMNKQEAYVKEAVEITFTTKQMDHTTNMFFFLKPKKNSSYKIYLLKKENKELSYHNSTTTFKYILFPLEAKDIVINFDFVIKTASDNAVKQAYVADHDDSIAINMSRQRIETTPLTLHVKKLKKSVDLIGEFTLNSKIDTQTINQYESVNLLYTLQGVGYNEKNITLITHIPNVTQFFENDHDAMKLTKDGFKIKRRFIYSMNAKQDFDIPPVILQAYSPKTDRYYTLSTPRYKITVKKIPTATLLDKEEYPQTKSFIDFTSFKQFFTYCLIFFLGFLTAKITQNHKIKKQKQKRFQDIKESSTPKELIIVLLNKYKEQNIDSLIKRLENLEYKGKGSFKAIKKAILRQIGSK